MTETLHKETPVSSGEEDVRQFLSEIRRYPLLSPEEERKLARRCAEGDENAIRQLVNSNLRLVVSVAREYAGRGVALLDLIQEGCLGLLVAARKFDYTLDFRFSTYATKWIRQGVTRCLLNHGCVIRVPLHTQEKMRKVLQVKNALHQELEREPSDEEIALRCDMSGAKVRELLLLNPEICSLDLPTGEGEEDTLGSVVEDLQAPQPQEALVRRELINTIDCMLAALTERQQQVLRLYYGLDDGGCHSLEQIGAILGISRERARQIKDRAMCKLRELGSDLGLEDFLE